MTYVYVTSPTTDTHIADESATPPYWPRRTLCGCVIHVDRGWVFSDETLSGVSADCDSCRIILKARRDP